MNMFNNNKDSKGIKGWIERIIEKKEEREARQLLELRLNTADNLYNMAKDLLNRETRIDKEDALRSALIACETYQEAVQYDKQNYINLFHCQRLIASICWGLKDFDNSYKYAKAAVDSLQEIAENQIAKQYEYIEYIGAYYEFAMVCANLKKDTEAAKFYCVYIEKLNCILQCFPEDMEQYMAEYMRESARMLHIYRSNFGFVEFDKEMDIAYHVLTGYGNRFSTLASDVANYYAMSAYDMNGVDFNKAMNMLHNNYMQIRQLIIDGKTYDKIYFDLVFSACNLQLLHRDQNKVGSANKLSSVAVRYLPKAIQNYKQNSYKNCMINTDRKYEYIINTLKKHYVPTLPAEKKQEVMKALNSCQNLINTESFADFDI